MRSLRGDGMLDFLYENAIIRGVLCSVGAILVLLVICSRAVCLTKLSLDEIFGDEIFGGGFNIYKATVESEEPSGGAPSEGEAAETDADKNDGVRVTFAEADLSAASALDILDLSGCADIPTSGFGISRSEPLGDPAILIIHTHGSESYRKAGESDYSAGDSFRSAEPENGVVAAGRILADALIEHGIGVIHCETMFDIDSYSDAYKSSALAVSAYLRLYPTIDYVIDLHRDSIELDGRQAAARTYIDGKAAAQLMFVVGSDAAGAEHPNWRSNLALACEIQKIIYAEQPKLVRQINIRRESFNQQLSSGYLLIELGACGNSIDEVGITARILARAFAMYLGKV